MSDNTKVQVRREGEIGVVDVEGYINSDGGEEVAAACNGLLDDDVTVSLPGGELQIHWPGEGEVIMEGPVQEIFEGDWPT